MSLERQNPLDLSLLSEDIPDGDRVLTDIRALQRRIRSANDARQPYIEKQERLLRQRRGIRRPKVFPWPGANNHSWPLIDAICRRWKPGIVSLVTQADPVCYFWSKDPAGYAAQPAAQDYWHWRFHQMTGLQKTVLELAEYLFQHGKAYTRQGWEFKTERICSLCRINEAFPNGVAAAVQEYNAQLDQRRAQTAQAVAAQQAPEAALAAIPQNVDEVTFLLQYFEQEYSLSKDIPIEFEQLKKAVGAVLQGAQVVKFYAQKIKKDQPTWKALSPLNVIVPPRCNDLEEADFIAVEHYLSNDDLLKMALDGHLDQNAVQAVIEKNRNKNLGDSERNAGIGDIATGTRSQIVDVLDRSDGISPGQVQEPNVNLILEVYCKMDLDGDGVLEKCVLWLNQGSGNNYENSDVLALYPYPYPFSEWPIVDFEFEHCTPRPYGSRGAAELLSVFQATVNKIHNARLDAIQITLAPMFQMRTTAADEHRNLKFMPGLIIPVTTVGDIAPLPTDAKSIQQFLMEENVTKSLAEQYIGVFDPGILAENAAERRTATEVDAVLQQTQSIFGQDATLFQAAMKRVHHQLWALELEFGPEQVYYRVVGEDKPRLCKKWEIAFEYELAPAGTPANTSQALSRKRALEAIQLFGQDMTGLINKHELYNHYFTVQDRNLGKLVVRSEEQAALVQQMLQISAQMNNGKPSAPAF